MEEKRIGRQTPTRSFVLPYSTTLGAEAIALYNSTGRTAQQWQELVIYDILARNEDDLWTHTKFGYSVPRRNGKNEIVSIREMYGLLHGEHMLHTAHRTTTSHAAWERLCALMAKAGYIEKEHYTTSKQFGLERIKMIDGDGECSFRTRSSKGGLGEGFDLLIIDEAQEYTDDQESALKYVVTDSKNPQTIMLGTPPTPVSSGTIFTKFRQSVLHGGLENAGWAEWSVPTETDPRDKEAWYEANPSLGTVFTERSVTDEIGADKIDFNIQRLGLWIRYNQKSAISEVEWKELQCKERPVFTGKLSVGIKFNVNGESVAMAVAVKTTDGKVFVECIDCRTVRQGIDWIITFLKDASKSISNIVIDGANGQKILCDAMKDASIKKKPILPTVGDIIVSSARFESALFAQSICHGEQPALMQIISNCEKRAIGSNGGFGYRSIKDGADIALMDSVILAHWACLNETETKKQSFNY